MITLRDLTAKLKIKVDEEELNKIAVKIDKAVSAGTEKVGGFEKFLAILRDISLVIASLISSVNVLSAIIGSGLLIFIVLIFNRLKSIFLMSISFISRIKVVRDIAGFLFSKSSLLLSLFAKSNIGKQIGSIATNIKLASGHVKLIGTSIEKVSKGAAAVGNGFASAGKKAQGLSNILTSIPPLLKNIALAGGGLFVFFKLKQFMTGVKALKAELQDIQIIINSFVGRAGLKEIEKTVGKIASSSNDFFSRMEGRQAAAQFLKLGGTAKEFDESMEGISKKAAVLGIGLKDAATSFANAMKSGDVSTLANEGFISRKQADRFISFTKDMDENLKKVATRFFVLNNATKLNDKQMQSFNDRVNSINAGTRRLDNVINRFKQNFKFFSNVAVITSNALADLLKIVVDNKYIMFVLRLSSLVAIFLSLIVAVKGFVAILGIAIFKLGIFNTLINLLASKAALVALVLASLFLIIEDIFVLLKGGEAFLGPYLKMFDKWISDIPIVGKLWEWLKSIIEPVFKILSKGVSTGKWAEAFRELGDVIKTSLVAVLKDTVDLFDLLPGVISRSFSSAKNYIAGLTGFGGEPEVAGSGISRDPSTVGSTNSVNNTNNNNNATNSSINIQNINVNANTPQEGRAAASAFMDEINKVIDDRVRETELSFPVQSN